MSGGSYDYLCDKDSKEILGCLGTVEEMANSLAAQGYALPASMTREVIHLARVYQSKMEFLLNKLNVIWHAEEWYRSCDFSEQDLDEAVEKFLTIIAEGMLAAPKERS